MAEIQLKSFPFDSLEVLNTESGQMENDRVYEAEIFRKYFAKFLSNGVYYGDYNNYKENSMKVTADGGLNIRVATGAGLIKGADFENTEDRIFILERPEAGERIDRVVVKFDTSLGTRATKLYIKEGSGSTPAELQRDDNIYEICLAEITVKSTTNITQDDISDTRPNSELCGIVNSLISVDGEELYQRFKDYIESIKSNLVLKDNIWFFDTVPLEISGISETNNSSLRLVSRYPLPEGFTKNNAVVLSIGIRKENGNEFNGCTYTFNANNACDNQTGVDANYQNQNIFVEAVMEEDIHEVPFLYLYIHKFTPGDETVSFRITMLRVY